MQQNAKDGVEWGLLIGGFIGLFAGLPLILMICCATILLTRIVYEEYHGYLYGAGIGLSLMTAFGPLVTMFIGLAMLIAGTLLKAFDNE